MSHHLCRVVEMNHIVFARHFGEGIPTMPVIPRLVIEPETQRSTNLGLNAKQNFQQCQWLANLMGTKNGYQK